MLRLLTFLAGLATVVAGAAAVRTVVPSPDLAWFGPTAAVMLLLAGAVLLPLLAGARADRQALPLRAVGRFLVRQSYLEAAILAMLGASMLIAALVTPDAPLWATAGVALAAVAFVFAASMEHLFPYTPGYAEAPPGDRPRAARSSRDRAGARG